MASDQPASLSPFTHFAYQPQLPEPSSSSVPFLILQSFFFLLLVSHSRSKDPQSPLVSSVPLRKSLRKRKVRNLEENSSSMHVVSRQKKKKKEQVSTTDSKVPGVFHTYISEAMHTSIQLEFKQNRIRLRYTRIFEG